MDAFQYIDNFKATPTWAEMLETVEDSPYHREENTAVHTEMVIDQYVQRFAAERTYRQNTIALIALLFHDTGKPQAEETLEKKDGSGTYRRYAGHEQVSAVAFTEQYVKDPVLRDLLCEEDARAVRFIIEHHLPYGLKDGKKRSDLHTAILHALREDADTFYDCLRSDAAGRISDDHATKLQNVEDWIREFRTVPLTINKHNSTMGTCYVLIGPSGSGKTTWMNKHRRASTKVLSRDAFYLEFHASHHGEVGFTDSGQLYDHAWRFCCIDNKQGFEKFLDEKIKDVFANAKISKGNVFVDNTNGSKKARAKYIQAARNIGMRIVAVEFWNTAETLIRRQQSRGDKYVPTSSVMQQVMAQTCALKGSEVDEVIMVIGN